MRGVLILSFCAQRRSHGREHTPHLYAWILRYAQDDNRDWLNRLQPAGGIADALEAFDAEPVGHAEEEIRHRLRAVTREASRRERAAAGAGENHRQVVVRVPVAVGIAAAIDDHRIVQERFSVDV